MRILLDECLPRRLKNDLPDHEVKTVPEAGWTGKKNGDLLRLAASAFDVLLTVDASLEFQQNMSGFAMAVLALRARSNRLEDLRPLMGRVREILAGRPRPGSFTRVGD